MGLEEIVIEYEKKHVSASQLRKFAWSKEEWRDYALRGIKPEQTQAMIEGVAFHSAMEQQLLTWQRTGELAEQDNNGRVVHAARCLIEALGGDLEGWAIEHSFEAPIEGTQVVDKFVGVADMLRADGPDVTIVDHKTIADESRALTRYQLPRDVQMMLYAALHTGPGGKARLVHNYVLRTGPHRCWQIEATVTYDQAQTFLRERVMPLVYSMDSEWVQHQEEKKEMETNKQLRVLLAGTWPQKAPEGWPTPTFLHDWLADEMDSVTEEQCRLWCAVNFAHGPALVLEKAHENGKFDLDKLPAVLFAPANDKLSELAVGHLAGSYDLVIGRTY